MSSSPVIALRNAAFCYDSAEEPLFSEVSAHFARGFTGIVGANGAGKTTLLRLAIGELRLTSGALEGASTAVYCAQRTDIAPAGFDAFLEDWDGPACELRGRLGIREDFLVRWDSLSHGERKRAQIAHALWQSPDLLAIDEPTNHIDAEARELLLSSLREFRGIGLIVSHDRDLLDELCYQCLWLEPPAVHCYPGGFSRASEQKQDDAQSAQRRRTKAVQESRKLQRAIDKRRERAAGEHRVRSKRGLSSKDSDAREKIDRARATDGGGGAQLRQLGGRFQQAQQRLEAARVGKEYSTGIWLDGARTSRDAVLRLPPGEVPLGDGRCLKWPDIHIRPDDRIAITGGNGTGKSTWINAALPLANVPREHVVYLPQEVAAATAQQLIARCQALPREQLGQIMTIVSRLNSRPERLLGSRQPSPGEARKLLLAMGMARSPQLIVMDEPTNHLDLPSVEALEQALSDCPCALLVVSHDQRFIGNIGADTWKVEVDAMGDAILTTG